MTPIALIFGSLYGFQNKNKRSLKDLGFFYGCYIPAAVLNIYSHTTNVPEFRYNPGQGLKNTLIITPIAVAANIGFGYLIGDMARKAILDTDV